MFLTVVAVLLAGVGVFLSCRLGFLQVRRFGWAMKHTVGELFRREGGAPQAGGVSPFQAVSTALAATIGTGSIAGVATAVTAGGPGAVFWMWVSAFLGMATKYAEIVLSLTFREKTPQGDWVGGPMYYLRRGLKSQKAGNLLAILFSLFAMAACLGIGNAVQANAIANSLHSTAGVPPAVTGAALTLLVGVVILGGVRRIAAVNEKLVPFMALFYLVCALAALACRASALPAAFGAIFKDAFSLRSAAGGVAGYGVLRAVTVGISKGVFSNEAGLGSAPIAHAASAAPHPAAQGLWGIFEVFFTTMVVCTVSALVILTAGVYADPAANGLDGAALSIASFRAVLPFGGAVVTAATVLFALSSLLGWAYYGEVAARWLAKNKTAATAGYRLLYVSVVFVGAVTRPSAVWTAAEIMNGLMALPNLVGLICLSGVVVQVTRDLFAD